MKAYSSWSGEILTLSQSQSLAACSLRSWIRFDANTSKLAEDVPVVGVADVRKTWKIIPLSQIELKLIEDGVLYDQAKAVYLDLKNGVGTQAQRIARIEAVLAWILKRIALLEKGEIVG